MSYSIFTIILIVVFLLVVVLPVLLIIIFIRRSSMIKNAMYKNNPEDLYANPLLNDILKKALNAPKPLMINLYIDRIVLGNESYFYATCGVSALHAKDLPTVAHWYCQALAKKAKYEIRYAYGRQTNLQRPHITLQGYIVCPEGVV